MKKSILYSLILVAAAVAFTAATTTGNGYKPGDDAKDFSLKNIDGKMVALADFKAAKGFIVIFTCNHCPFARAYEQRIVALDQKYKPLGYPVIAINPNDPTEHPDDSYENMIKNAKDKGFTFPYLHDESQATAFAYGAEKTPHIYLLHKTNGKLNVKYTGAIDNNWKDAAQVTEKYLENAVDALLAGKEVPLATTKAIGCSIKWKK